VLIGNKSDLESERKVDYQEGRDYADGQGLIFFEASAKTGGNIPEIFNTISEIIPKEETRKKKKGFKLKDDYMKYLCC